MKNVVKECQKDLTPFKKNIEETYLLGKSINVIFSSFTQNIISVGISV